MRFSLFIHLAFLTLFSQNIQADTLTVNFVGNNWCPQHCIDNKKSPGYLVEIAQAALKVSNINSTMTFEPWLRAIKNVKDGTYDGLLTPAQSEEKELLRHKISLSSQKFCFYSKKSDNVKLDKLHNFKDKFIAFTRGNNLGAKFMEYIKQKKNNVEFVEIVSNNKEFAPRIFKFLIQRNIDAIAITEDFGDYYLGQNKHLKELVEKKYCLQEELLHVGLSPSDITRSTKIAKYLDIGLKEIRENGTYDKILNKYFLKIID